jgi:hypothetical protein
LGAGLLQLGPEIAKPADARHKLIKWMQVIMEDLSAWALRATRRLCKKRPGENGAEVELRLQLFVLDLAAVHLPIIESVSSHNSLPRMTLLTATTNASKTHCLRSTRWYVLQVSPSDNESCSSWM